LGIHKVGGCLLAVTATISKIFVRPSICVSPSLHCAVSSVLSVHRKTNIRRVMMHVSEIAPDSFTPLPPPPPLHPIHPSAASSMGSEVRDHSASSRRFVLIVDFLLTEALLSCRPLKSPNMKPGIEHGTVGKKGSRTDRVRVWLATPFPMISRDRMCLTFVRDGRHGTRRTRQVRGGIDLFACNGV